MAIFLGLLRDAALRRIASRNHIIVASLAADRKASDVDTRAPIAPKQRSGGGSVFIPTRYGLDDQWALAREALVRRRLWVAVRALAVAATLRPRSPVRLLRRLRALS